MASSVRQIIEIVAATEDDNDIGVTFLAAISP